MPKTNPNSAPKAPTYDERLREALSQRIGNVALQAVSVQINEESINNIATARAIDAIEQQKEAEPGAVKKAAKTVGGLVTSALFYAPKQALQVANEGRKVAKAKERALKSIQQKGTGYEKDLVERAETLAQNIDIVDKTDMGVTQLAERGDAETAGLRSALSGYARKVAKIKADDSSHDRELEQARKAVLAQIGSNESNNYESLVDKVGEGFRGVYATELGGNNATAKAKVRRAIDKYFTDEFKSYDASMNAGLDVKESAAASSRVERLVLDTGSFVGIGAAVVETLAMSKARSKIGGVLKYAVIGVFGGFASARKKKGELERKHIQETLGEGHKSSEGLSEKMHLTNNEKLKIDMMDCKATAEELSDIAKAIREGSASAGAIDVALDRIAEISARRTAQAGGRMMMFAFSKTDDGKSARENIEAQKTALYKAMVEAKRALLERGVTKQEIKDHKTWHNKDGVETSLNTLEQDILDSKQEQKKQTRLAAIGGGLKSAASAFVFSRALQWFASTDTGKAITTWLSGTAIGKFINGLGKKGDGDGPKPSGVEVNNGTKNFEASTNGKNLIFTNYDGEEGQPEVFLDVNHDGVLSDADLNPDVFNTDVNGDGSVTFEDLRIASDIHIDEVGMIAENDLGRINDGLERYGFKLEQESVLLDTTHQVINTVSVDEYLKGGNVETETFTKKVYDTKTDVYIRTPKGQDYDGDGTIDAWRVRVTGNADKIGESQIAVTLKDELGKNTVQVFDIHTDANGHMYADIPYGMCELDGHTVNDGALLADRIEIASFNNGVEQVHATIRGTGAIDRANFVQLFSTEQDTGVQYNFCSVDNSGAIEQKFGSVEIPGHLYAVKNFVEDYTDANDFSQAFHEQVHYTEGSVALANGEMVRDMDVEYYNPKTDQYYAFEGSGENGELYNMAGVSKNRTQQFGLETMLKFDEQGNIVNQAEVVHQQLNGIATTPEIALTYATSEGTWLNEDYIENVVGHDVPGLSGAIDTQDEFNIVADMMRNPDESELYVNVTNRTIDEHLSLMDGGRVATEKIGQHLTAYTYASKDGSDLNVGFQRRANSDTILVCYDKDGIKTTSRGTMGLILGSNNGATDGYGIYCGSQPKLEIEKEPVSDGTEGSENSENSETSETSENDESTGSENSENTETTETSENDESTGSENSETIEAAGVVISETSETSETTETTEAAEIQGKNAEAIEKNMGIHGESTNKITIKGVTEKTEIPTFDTSEPANITIGENVTTPNPQVIVPDNITVNVDYDSDEAIAAQNAAEIAARKIESTPGITEVKSNEDAAKAFAQFLNKHNNGN